MSYPYVFISRSCDVCETALLLLTLVCKIRISTVCLITLIQGTRSEKKKKKRKKKRKKKETTPNSELYLLLLFLLSSCFATVSSVAKSFTLPLTACILHQQLTKTGLVKPNGHKRTRIPKVKLIQLQTISLLGNNADLINLKKRKKKKKNFCYFPFLLVTYIQAM